MPIPITDPGLAAEQCEASMPAELITPDGRSIGGMTAAKVEEILAAAKRLSENPLFEEYLKAVEEYRRLHNTVPDDD